MSGFSFRPSRPGDAGALHRVWSRAVQATHDFLRAEDFEQISDMVREAYFPNAEFLAAERRGDIVGFMGMTGAMIDSLFIDPDSIGRGLGRLFVERAAETANPRDVEVNEQNTGAVAFYRRLGFTQTARRERDDQGRAYPILVMRRDQPA